MANTPAIPEIPRELRDAVSALANSAYTLRGVLRIVLEELVERVGYQGLPSIVAEKLPYLELADRVVDGWCEHLGIDPDAETSPNGKH